MSKVKIELNEAGVRELLQSPEAQAMCLEKAQEIKGRCPDIGYTADVKVGKYRAIASVYAKSIEAKQDNAKNNTLLKARY